MFSFNKNNFDLIRLLAAVQVVIVHASEHLNYDEFFFFKVLGIFPGVPIFFVTSGFLICASLHKDSNTLNYFRKRVLRIFPALWVSLFVSVLIIYSFFKVDIISLDFFYWFIAQATFAQFYNPDFLRGFGIGVLNGSLWTITIELQFYIILPILFWLYNKVLPSKSFMFLLFLIILIINQVATLGLYGFGGITQKLLKVTIFPYLYYFMIGVFLFFNQSLISNFLAKKFNLIVLFYFSVVLILFFNGVNVEGNYITTFQSFSLCLLTISFAYQDNFILSAIRRNLKGIDVSYGVYIYHMLVINIYIELGLSFGDLTSLTLVLVSTFIIAYMSWCLIEKPILNKKQSTKADSLGTKN